MSSFDTKHTQLILYNNTKTTLLSTDYFLCGKDSQFLPLNNSFKHKQQQKLYSGLKNIKFLLECLYWNERTCNL